MTQRANPGDVMGDCQSTRASAETPPAVGNVTVLHIPMSAGLDQGLRAFAKTHGIQAETAAREAIRAYVGDDR